MNYVIKLQHQCKLTAICSISHCNIFFYLFFDFPTFTAFNCQFQLFFNNMSTESPANIIGSLTFCPECGNLLDMAGGDDDILLCNQCSCAFRTAGVEATEVITTSSERSFQSALKSKRHLVQQSKENKQARAIVSTISCCLARVYS